MEKPKICNLASLQRHSLIYFSKKQFKNACFSSSVMKHLISACSGCFPSYPCFSMQLYRESFPKCNSYSFSCEIKAATCKKRRKLYSQRKTESVFTPATLLKLQAFNSGMLIVPLQKAGANGDRWPGQHCLLQLIFRIRASCVWGKGGGSY